MSSLDLIHNIKATAGWAGATISSDTTTTSSIVIDTQGFESVAFAVYSGTITDGSYALKILETDNSDGTTGAAEVAAYQGNTGPFILTSDSVVMKVGAKTNKRYCTLSIVSTGTSSGGVFKGAVALLGGAHNAPVA